VLHFDTNSLPIHGVPWSQLAWVVVASGADRLTATLDWNRSELLAVFPFPHRMEMAATLLSDGLRIETTLVAGNGGPVPASFGFHPYLGLPGRPRAQWRLHAPAMRRLLLDERGLPTGNDAPFPGFDALLAERRFDDGYALLEPAARFSIAAGDRLIAVDFLEGFTHAQIYAPPDKTLIALEPMTAATAALNSGRGLRIIAPGQALRTAFALRASVG
jgi:aldose 1-epimerase